MTDKYLLFNWTMYHTILDEIKEQSVQPFFTITLLSLSLAFFTKNEKSRLIILSLMISSLIFLVLAAKSIYFHNYYLYFFVFSVIVLASNWLYYAYKIFSSHWLGMLLVGLVIVGIAQSNIKQIDPLLSAQSPYVWDVASYLQKNMQEDEFYVDNGMLTAVSLYSNRKEINESLHDVRGLFASDVDAGLNVAQIAEKYKIKYYVVNKYIGITASNFVRLGIPTPSPRISDNISGRTRSILCRENEICDTENETNVSKYFGERVLPHLKLEKEIGKYQIYSFVE